MLGVTDQLSVSSSESFFGGILFALFLPSFYHSTFFLTCFWLAPAVFLTLYSPTCFTLRADEITVMKKRAKAQDARPHPLVVWMEVAGRRIIPIGYRLSAVKAGRYQLIIFFTLNRLLFR